MNRVKHGEDVGGAAAGNEPEAAEIAHSAIVILVPEADPLVAAYRERYDPAAARSGPVPALFEPLHRWLGVLFFYTWCWPTWRQRPTAAHCSRRRPYPAGRSI